MKDFTFLAITFTFTLTMHAELGLHAIVSDQMVLQQMLANPVWSRDVSGTTIKVEFTGQSHTATVGADGKWTVRLVPLPANTTPPVTGSSTRAIQDVSIDDNQIELTSDNARARPREPDDTP